MLESTIALICAALIGLTLGILGAGGAVLTIPVFVYLLRVPTQDAISCSLFVVCLTSLSAGIRYSMNKQVNGMAVLYFGIPSIVSVWIFRFLVFPRIPDPLMEIEHYSLSKSSGLLMLFALLMLYSAFNMLKPQSKEQVNKDPMNMHAPNWLTFIGWGVFVGALTGLLGAGGGFLIVPALVLYLGLDFKTAAASSLCIIFLNTTVGLVSNVKVLESLPWYLLILFTSITILSSFGGIYISSRVNARQLKPTFGILLIFVAVFMILFEFIG